MVLDPSLFHQPDNHWHEVPNTHAGYDSSAHHWPHDRALRHRVQDVPGHAALPAETLPRHRRRAEGPWFLGPSGHPENVLVKLKEPLEPDARPLEERPILSSAVETRTSRAGKGGKVPEKAVPWYPEVPPNEGGAWGILGGQQPGGQEPLPADCFPALEARSLRHAIAYSNIDGQEQVHETKVTCSGEDCETMSNDVMPQIIRVRTPTKAAKPRLCTGSPFQGPGLVWDGFDNLAHRVANSARRLFGYTPAADDVRHDEIAMPPANHKSEGIMKSYVYFNNNGHEEMKQIESHCKDGTCVQRTRTFAPHSLQAVHHPVPQAATADQHVHKVHAAAGQSPQARPDIQHSTHQATGMPYEA